MRRLQAGPMGWFAGSDFSQEIRCTYLLNCCAPGRRSPPHGRSLVNRGKCRVAAPPVPAARFRIGGCPVEEALAIIVLNVAEAVDD